MSRKTPSSAALESLQHTQDQNAPLVLVADDEPGIREVLCECLEDSGYRVIAAANGAEALNAFESQQPDLIISDVVMPEMDGITLLKRLRPQHPDMRAILMSGYTFLAQEALQHQVHELGVTVLLEKPLQLLNLLTCVNMLLNPELDSENLGTFQAGDLPRKLIRGSQISAKVAPCGALIN
jgi:CheY-like chemotaxis protein